MNDPVVHTLYENPDLVEFDVFISQLHDLQARLAPVLAPALADPAAVLRASTLRVDVAIAVVAHLLTGASLVSATVDGDEHWFNRIVVNGAKLEFDLAGRPLSLDNVAVDVPGALHADARKRSVDEIETATLVRAAVLAGRAGFTKTHDQLQAMTSFRLLAGDR